MQQKYKKISGQRKPFVVLASVFILSTISVILALITIYNTNERRDKNQFILLEIEGMRGDILYTKGLMDKAVFMAAFTADPKWKDRYTVYHGHMLKSFNKLREIAPKILEEVAENLNSSNDRVLDIHKSAFLLIDADLKPEAMYLLVDSEYEKYEGILKKSLQNVDNELDKLVVNGQKSARKDAVNQLYLTIGFISVIFCSWLISWVILHRWRTTLKDSEEQREWIFNELEKSAYALKQSQTKYEAIIKYAVDGILTIEKDGKISSCNRSAQKILKKDEQDILNKGIETILPLSNSLSDTATHFSIEGYFRLIGAERREYTLINASEKSKTYIEITVSRILIDTNETYTVLIRDISSRKAAEKAEKMMDIAQRKNEAKSAFLANMSHELRTPMNGVIGIADLMSRTNLNEVQRDFVSTIKKSAHILHNVINDILDFSKIEDNSLTLEKIPFNLYHTVSDVIDIFSVIAAKNKIDIMLDYQPGVLHNIIGDPGRISQILNNLFNNAIKFTKSGYILIKIQEEKVLPSNKVMLKFSVTDTGVGIKKENINEIFNRFTQADESITRQYGGTGLGLTICKELAHLMEGDIGVSSDEGEGATFWFTIIVEALKGPLINNQYKDYSGDSLKGKNILVVEDNEINAKIIKESLVFFDAKCTIAPTAESANITLNDNYDKGVFFDIAIVDHKLPGMNGLLFGQNLKNNKKFSQLPLIAFTSIASNTSFKNFEATHFNGYLAKPIKGDILKNMICKIINTKDLNDIVTQGSLMNVPDNTSVKLKNSYRILIVEDDTVNQKVIRNILNELGCTSVLADNGQVALDILEADDNFDLILMDMQMPILDGISTTKRIREIEKEKYKKEISIIALTANATKMDEAHCRDAGMDSFLSKPVTIEACEQAILDWEGGFFNKRTAKEGGTSSMTPSETTKVMEISKTENMTVDMEYFNSVTSGDKQFQLEIVRQFIEGADVAIENLKTTGKGSDLWIENAHKLTGSSFNVGATSLGNLCKKAEFDFEKHTKEKLLASILDNYALVKIYFEKNINNT
ncbi:MAG: PAS domain S-box-containing protein [Alphaproteobacteria bacterium]|jgi:PAS domain S-box-containing protein